MSPSSDVRVENPAVYFFEGLERGLSFEPLTSLLRERATFAACVLAVELTTVW